jgi:hypothetical protein
LDSGDVHSLLACFAGAFGLINGARFTSSLTGRHPGSVFSFFLSIIAIALKPGLWSRHLARFPRCSRLLGVNHPNMITYPIPTLRPSSPLHQTPPRHSNPPKNNNNNKQTTDDERARPQALRDVREKTGKERVE